MRRVVMPFQSPHYTQRCESAALFFLTLCFFANTVSVTLTTILYLLAFLFVLLSGQWHVRIERIKKNPAALSFWLIGSLFIIGIFYATSTAHFIFRDIQKNHWLLITPFFIGFLTQAHWRQRMLTAFLSAMIFTLVLSYIQFIFKFSFLQYLHFPRWQFDTTAVFSDHIVQSLSMSIAAFICGYRVLFFKMHRKMQFFYVALFILMMVNVLWMSKARVCYVIFFLLLLYLSLLRFGWKRFLVTAFLGVILVSAPFFLSQEFKSHITIIYKQYTHSNQYHQGDPLPYNRSTYQRVEMWHIAQTMIRQRPWFGYGTGGIRTALPQVVPAKDRIFNPSIDYVESLYLNFLLEFGLFGFAVFIFAIVLQIKTSFHLPQEYRALMQAVLIAILFGGIFNGFFVSFSVAHLYALFSALCFSALPRTCLRAL